MPNVLIDDINANLFILYIDPVACISGTDGSFPGKTGEKADKLRLKFHICRPIAAILAVFFAICKKCGLFLLASIWISRLNDRFRIESIYFLLWA